MQPSGKAGKLYGLPKLHKEPQAGKSIPKCRPIISNCGSNTEQISAFIDIHSKHLVKKLDSFVEDTPDLLRMIQMENETRRQPVKSFPVTVDVVSLYTNIPTYGLIGGLQAFRKALETRTIDDKVKIPTQYLVDMLQLVLDGNIFEFNSQL